MAEPVSLALAKAQCRVLGDDEDELLGVYIAAGQDWVETFTGKLLERRQVTERHDRFWPEMRVEAGPDPVLEAVTYRDLAGATQTLAGAQLIGEPARLVWPSTLPAAGWPGDVRVTVTAGYADDARPIALVQAMLLLIGHWFDHRAAVVTGSSMSGATTVPLAAEALCQPYRRMRC